MWPSEGNGAYKPYAILMHNQQRILHYTTQNTNSRTHINLLKKQCNSDVMLLMLHTTLVLTCTELVLKVMDAGYCLYVHIFMSTL